MTVIDTLIGKYRKAKTAAFFRQRLYSANKQYAFIGVGPHSLSHLYPVLHHFNLPLKYIFTRSSSHAERMLCSFPGAVACHDLDQIAGDDSVKGVFICTPPAEHFSIALKMLAAGKHVYLEKPPCYSLEQLTALEEQSKALNCFVGLQKRFSALNGLLAAKVSGAFSYHCQYLVGAYPEGNPVYDLFIHPVENCIRLFGNARVAYLKNNAAASSTGHWHLVLEHQQASGVLELSTAHNWHSAKDRLVINTEKEVLTADYPGCLTGEEKTAAVFGVPLEKIIKRPSVVRQYYSNTGVVPTTDSNDLFVQGFYGAIDEFVAAVEKDEIKHQHHITTLRNTFEVLDQMNKLKFNSSGNV